MKGASFHEKASMQRNKFSSLGGLTEQIHGQSTTGRSKLKCLGNTHTETERKRDTDRDSYMEKVEEQRKG
jgi:hypothetical protein